MSSKTKKISKDVEEYEKRRAWECDHSLLGSIMMVLGHLNGTSYEKIYKDHINVEKKIPAGDYSVKSLCDFIMEKYYPIKEEQKKLLVLCLDKEKQYTPVVTIKTEDGLWPVSPDGVFRGVLVRPERIEYEYIYDEE